MPEIRLSFIISFYNVEKYITQCLDSVYSQNIPENAYEVICVNDSSPDNSREIVLEYQQKHSNLRLIEHEKNKMLGAGRNTGLRAAQGKYIWFIDSDDYIKANILGYLLDVVCKNELEILQFNALRYTNGVLSEIDWYHYYNSVIMTGYDYLNFDKVVCECWTKIYLKDFLLDNSILFPEGVFYEDQTHFIATMLKVKRFMLVSDSIYFYRYREDSISNSSDIKSTGRSFADTATFCCACIDLLDKHKDKAFLEKRINNYIWISYHSAKLSWQLPFKEQKIFCKRLRLYGFNGNILKKYTSFKIYSNYTYPFLIFVYKYLYKIVQLRWKLRKKELRQEKQ
jgi:glycosyltransferase involved in cell wall biosynthesis